MMRCSFETICGKKTDIRVSTGRHLLYTCLISVTFNICHWSKNTATDTTLWNRKRPRALVQNQQTREVISARKTSLTGPHKVSVPLQYPLGSEASRIAQLVVTLSGSRGAGLVISDRKVAGSSPGRSSGRKSHGSTAPRKSHGSNAGFTDVAAPAMSSLSQPNGAMAHQLTSVDV